MHLATIGQCEFGFLAILGNNNSKAETGLPVRALLRPRFGDFCYDRYELAQMAETAAALVQACLLYTSRCV